MTAPALMDLIVIANAVAKANDGPLTFEFHVDSEVVVTSFGDDDAAAREFVRSLPAPCDVSDWYETSGPWVQRVTRATVNGVKFWAAERRAVAVERAA